MQNFKGVLMKVLNVSLITICLLSVAGCIDAAPRDTTPRVAHSQRVINVSIGKPVTRLIDQWGAPTKSYTISGREYVVYVEEGTRSGGSRRYGSAYSYSYVGCTWTWEIKNGIIVSGNAVGEDCDG